MLNPMEKFGICIPMFLDEHLHTNILLFPISAEIILARVVVTIVSTRFPKAGLAMQVLCILNNSIQFQPMDM